jgi:hypothetical protein
MKQSSLFFLFSTEEIHQTWMMLHIAFLVSLESSRGGGEGGGVHWLGFMAFGLVV